MAGAGTALAGGIGAGQGFWEYAPNATTMSEADALAKVTGDSTLKTAAEKELEVLKEKKIDEIAKDAAVAFIYSNGDPISTDEMKLSELEVKTKLFQHKFDNTLTTDFKDLIKKNITLITQCIADPMTNKKVYNQKFLASAEKILKHIEAYDKLDLKDTPSVQKLTKESLKTATQKVEGFMKWGYAKAEDLEKIGGKELVEHANSSKIALAAGALVAGAGAGTLAYFLLNKPKPTPQTDS